MKIAVIGAGISGLAVARMLVPKHEVTLWESAARPGGLVKCETVDGVLYHTTGGHVFNSRRQDVLDWFWGIFNKEEGFHKAVRHAVVSLGDGTLVDYPIENHLYQMPQSMRQAVVRDLLGIHAGGYGEPDNFDDFLRGRFGETLYREYFEPYNRKIWGRSLKDVPLGWLQGKLPMPGVEEILEANISKEQEMKMVHSSFWYPLHGGSQYLADTLAQGLDIRYGRDISAIELKGGKWHVEGEAYDCIIYTGNARRLPATVGGELDITAHAASVAKLEYHGTTPVLCEVDPNPYSWIYMPSPQHESHRIICTGNFSPNNDNRERSTAIIEFTRKLTKEEILANLAKIPFHPTYITHRYAECTYPVQNGETKGIINALKQALHPHRFYLLGRFAEWEYYNMDAAMGAAMDLVKQTNLTP